MGGGKVEYESQPTKHESGRAAAEDSLRGRDARDVPASNFLVERLGAVQHVAVMGRGGKVECESQLTKHESGRAAAKDALRGRDLRDVPASECLVKVRGIEEHHRLPGAVQGWRLGVW